MFDPFAMIADVGFQFLSAEGVYIRYDGTRTENVRFISVDEAETTAALKGFAIVEGSAKIVQVRGSQVASFQDGDQAELEGRLHAVQYLRRESGNIHVLKLVDVGAIA